MHVNYMVKAQSIIEFQAQGELKSSLFANPFELHEWISQKRTPKLHTNSIFDVLDTVGNLRR
jgi:hypothetical protein